MSVDANEGELDVDHTKDLDIAVRAASLTIVIRSAAGCRSLTVRLETSRGADDGRHS